LKGISRLTVLALVYSIPWKRLALTWMSAAGMLLPVVNDHLSGDASVLPEADFTPCWISTEYCVALARKGCTVIDKVLESLARRDPSMGATA